jgi:hypothetical protein
MSTLRKPVEEAQCRRRRLADDSHGERSLWHESTPEAQPASCNRVRSLGIDPNALDVFHGLGGFREGHGQDPFLEPRDDPVAVDLGR